MPKAESKCTVSSYKNLSRINLHSLAHCVGILQPQSFSRDDLLLRVVSAHRVQQLYEGRQPDLTIDSKIYTYQHQWQAAVQLRSLGISDETIILLLKNGIRSTDQLQGLTFKVFVDSGIDPAQAEIIVLNFCGNKQINKFESNQMESDINYPNMALMISARYRCQNRTWPYENIPFLTFLEAFEYDLQLADPTGNEWRDFLRGALLGRSRCIAEKAIMKNPGISYQELKEIVIAGQTTDAEISDAFKILQMKYEAQTDIVRHIEQVKSAVKFIYPACSNEALIIILLLTLPTKLSEKVRKDMNICELDLVEKRCISEAKLYKAKVKSSKPIVAKPPEGKKAKKSCSQCGQKDHNVEQCHLKPKKKKKKNKTEIVKLEN
uniref:Uncharacterized protein n=1 Tax=Tetranychus urticae TaxID=32264 RepID=T1K2P8_TETUR